MWRRWRASPHAARRDKKAATSGYFNCQTESSSQLETSFSVWKISFLSSAITTAQMMFAHTRGNVGNEVLIISTASVTERHRCLRLSRRFSKTGLQMCGCWSTFSRVLMEYFSSSSHLLYSTPSCVEWSIHQPAHSAVVDLLIILYLTPRLSWATALTFDLPERSVTSWIIAGIN